MRKKAVRSRQKKKPNPAPLRLTDQQRAIMALVADGATDHEVGEQMGIAHGTVRKHIQNALTANELSSRLRLAVLIEREAQQ